MDQSPRALAPGLGRRGALPDAARLALLSFLMLFVELALIRWTGSNVVYLSYFSNFVLLGSFLGIGLGFLRARHQRDLSGWAPLALGVFVFLVRAFPVTISQEDPSVFFFSQMTPHGPPRELSLTLVFVFAAVIMMLVAEGVARCFVRFDPLAAYQWDLVGSLGGIVAFALLSLLQLPSLAWGIVVAGVIVALAAPRPPSLPQLVGVVVLLAVLGIESTTSGTSWSPYYKITAKTDPRFGDQLLVSVNGVLHQIHQPAAHAPGKRVYEVAHPPALDEVLVIGAGGGNDVAVALARGARHVDAVEIDPRLYDLGRTRHPDRPYDDPRVTIHIDDGRAFLERTNNRYDLIVLALPDSITLVSGQSSLRLESYLFTKEALSAARDRLTDRGVFAMYNYYRQPWLIDRYGSTLEQVYGTPPCHHVLIPTRDTKGIALEAFEASKDPTSLACAGTPRAEIWSRPAGEIPEAATDDHPYPYLRTRSIPLLYLVSLGIVLATSLVAVRGVGGRLRGMGQYWDLFFMGAAFLLLETKNVVQFALLFGTTWFVNALVFAGVLVSVLLAVAVSRRVEFRRPSLLYLVLLAGLGAAYLLPASALLDLPLVPRFGAAVAVAFFPIFTANLVFTQRFKATSDSTTAFGANLLGAMVGGVLEYLALVTGYRLLLAVVAVLYGLAFLTGRAHLRAAPA